jgi:Outer membrane protein beta-barrel domain
MKKLILLAVGISLFAMSSHAQSVDASVSYSYFRLGGSNGVNQNGVSGSLAFNHLWFGIVGDFGVYHAAPSGATLNTYTFLFGPRLTLRNLTKINPFVQGLVGGSRLSAGYGGTSAASNQFAFGFGGGVDIGMAPHIALRPQVDYVGLRNSGQTVNCTRVSLGIVLHL